MQKNIPRTLKFYRFKFKLKRKGGVGFLFWELNNKNISMAEEKFYAKRG